MVLMQDYEDLHLLNYLLSQYIFLEGEKNTQSIKIRAIANRTLDIITRTLHLDLKEGII